MNLGKLLGAGKSFISGGKPAAYREDKRFYLPQFVSPKNPFATPVADVKPGALPKPAENVSAGPARKSALPTSANTPKISGPIPVVAAVGPVRATTWAGKLNPISIFRHSGPVPGKSATAVQVELSLEKVKVVHNDLTDADVEIVPMKSRPAREPAAPAPAKNRWEGLGQRIMKATALYIW